MGSHENWPEGFDPAAPEALQAAVRLAFNVLLQAPHPAEFSSDGTPGLEQYRRWHEEQLRPLREVLFELVQATGETPPPEVLH